MIDKFIGQDIPEERRWQFIQDNADAVEEIGYMHRFTPEEKDYILDNYQEHLAE